MVDAPSALPWQQQQWQRLMRQRRGARMPHALLCQGPAGVGKTRFASRLAQLALCQQPAADGELACGACRSCVQFQAGLHPDYRVLEPLDDKKAIVVDQVREVIAWLVQTAHYCGPKLLLVPGAERMNTAAANALLKSLEEPPGEALMILASDRPGSLLATIRSRCQEIGFGAPSRRQGLEWLRAQQPAASADQLADALDLAVGGPVRALQALDAGEVASFQTLREDLRQVAAGRRDPVATVVAWKKAKHESLQVVDWMLTEVQAMIRGRMSGHGEAGGGAAAAQSPARLFEHLDRLIAAQGHIHAGQNPNKELLWESLLIPWQPAGTPRRRNR